VCSDGGMVPQRRADLAEFLRARRAALTPADVGLAPGTRRRTAGLRREEVALLAGVSVSWYTWLEQGRPVNASVDVLDALARALRLDAVEREHLLALAGHPHRRPVAPGYDRAPDALVHLLDALVPCPAYLLGPRWDLLAWNDAEERLFPKLATLPPEDRNLVWITFADADARSLIGDWEAEARRVLSQFRAETVPLRDDPAVAALIERLREASDEFRAWWPRHDVGGFSAHRRTFHHPQVGTLRFEHQQVVAAGEPDLRVVVHLGIAGDDSCARLAEVAITP
jgi:transcriptional regulator with XRE-family HTH domain